MNRNKLVTISFIIIIYLFAFSATTYFKYIEELEKISNGYQNVAAQKIMTNMFSGESGENNLKKIFKNEHVENFIIFDDSFNRSMLRGILIKGKVSSPNILTGRFFHKSDFFTEKKVVVIGENMVKYSHMKKGKRYFTLFNQDYEIIGICGYGANSTIDNMVYYNLDSEKPEQTGIYYIDGMTVSKTNLLINELSGFGDIELIIDEKHGIKRLLGYGKSADKTIFFLCFILFILFIIKSRSFYLTIEKTLSICRFVGYSWHHTICLTVKRWALYEGVGIISTVLLYFIICTFSDFKMIMNARSVKIPLIILALFFSSFVIYILILSFHWSKRSVGKC